MSPPLTNAHHVLWPCYGHEAVLLPETDPHRGLKPTRRRAWKCRANDLLAGGDQDDPARALRV